MKKNLLFMFFGLVALLGATLTSCSGSGADAKINALVEQMNSSEFKDQAVKSGVFTDADAKIEDGAVVLTFKTIPGLSFKNATPEMMEAQKAGMIGNFKQALPLDKVFREGFEGMKEKGMTFRMTFLDTNNDTASIDFTPAEVLD